MANEKPKGSIYHASLMSAYSTIQTAGFVGYFEDFEKAKTKHRAKRCHFWVDTDMLSDRKVQVLTGLNGFVSQISKIEWMSNVKYYMFFQ